MLWVLFLVYYFIIFLIYTQKFFKYNYKVLGSKYKKSFGDGFGKVRGGGVWKGRVGEGVWGGEHGERKWGKSC